MNNETKYQVTKAAFVKKHGNVMYVTMPISSKAISALIKLGFVVVIRK